MNGVVHRLFYSIYIYIYTLDDLVFITRTQKVTKDHIALSKHLQIFLKIRQEAIVLRFASKQSVQKQSYFTWIVGPACSVLVL